MSNHVRVRPRRPSPLRWYRCIATGTWFSANGHDLEHYGWCPCGEWFHLPTQGAAS